MFRSISMLVCVRIVHMPYAYGYRCCVHKFVFVRSLFLGSYINFSWSCICCYFSLFFSPCIFLFFSMYRFYFKLYFCSFFSYCIVEYSFFLLILFKFYFFHTRNQPSQYIQAHTHISSSHAAQIQLSHTQNPATNAKQARPSKRERKRKRQITHIKCIIFILFLFSFYW